MIGRKLSHYRVVERIGAGGMGVVYRAHDEQLDRDVAIKVLPPGSLADEVARKRFRKEALSLARLNHPNVATVHEFGTQDGADFLVTEYIAGITLDTRLVQGAVPVEEVVRLGLQLAEGLAAAHQQGVVHRDLKPGNLRLTADGRLKILDFGLAQPMPHPSEHGMTATITQSQDTTGTLPYMAPEQLGGEVADARTDIWSAGSVLYEMATGKRPFVQATPALLINAILNQTPEAPGKVNPAVPAVLEHIILKALQKDPAKRYQTARELATDLERTTAPTAPVPVQPKHRSGLLVLGLVAALLIGVFGGYFITQPDKRRGTAILAPKPRPAIAVLGFKNLSGNPEKSWLSTALSEMLATELSEGDQLRLIAGESVAQMKISLSLPEADSFSPETLVRIRQNLGSDNVVLGSYVLLGDGQLRLDVRLQDAIAGQTLASVSEKGNESEIDTLVSKAGATLRAKLGVGALSDAQSAMVRASLPASPDAARLYSEGLQKLRLFDARSARDLLEKAVTLDPDHAPTRSALAEAWSILGYENKAKDQAKKALSLSGQFSREERLLIEGRAHETLSEMPKAVESYQALWRFFPDNTDYGLFLIRAQIGGGHASDAETALADLRKLTVSEADAARIDLADANIASSQSDFKRQQALAERAASRGRAVGASLLVAQALQLEAQAWERMGQSQSATELLNRAGELYVSAGDRRGAARSLLLVGDLLYDKGDYEGAKKQFERALPVFQEIGAQKGVRMTVERIGNAFYSEGRLREAEKYYNQSLRIDRELNDLYGLAGDYGNLANAMDGLGDLPEALQMHRQSLAAFTQVGDRRGVSSTLNNLGDLFLEMGNLDEAGKHYQQSLALKREIAYRRGEPYALSGLGDTLLAGGDLAGARKRYEEGLIVCKEIKNEVFTAQLQASLAFIALIEKRYSDGETLARQSTAAYDKANAPGSNAWAHAVLARNLLGAGNLTEARKVASQAMALARQVPGQVPRFEAVLADSRVKAKSGKITEARQELESTLAATRKFGYRIYELQVRLALGEIELWAGSSSARTELAAVEKDARALGALLMASQAHALPESK